MYDPDLLEDQDVDYIDQQHNKAIRQDELDDFVDTFNGDYADFDETSELGLQLGFAQTYWE